MILVTRCSILDADQIINDLIPMSRRERDVLYWELGILLYFSEYCYLDLKTKQMEIKHD